MAVHPLLVGHHPFGVEFIEQEPGHTGKDKEAQDPQQDDGDVYGGIRHAADDRQGDNAQNVVNNSGAQNGVAGTGFQLAQFL